VQSEQPISRAKITRYNFCRGLLAGIKKAEGKKARSRVQIQIQIEDYVMEKPLEKYRIQVFLVVIDVVTINCRQNCFSTEEGLNCYGGWILKISTL